MKDKNILYTVLSVFALIIVVIGIVFAYKSWDGEKNNNNENNTLNS